MTVVVAIDGPAASGKSTTAAEVARRLGYLYVDSGALYRGLTRVALDLGDAPAPEAVLASAEARGLSLHVGAGCAAVVLDGRDAEGRIRGPEVTAAVSALAALPAIRAWVNQRLRALRALNRPLVLDGRDIGTAVFPDAAVKVYLTANPEVRARRRLLQQGGAADPAAVAAEAERIAARDRYDAGRAVAPLRAADDAVRVDTSALSFDAQVDRIVGLARAGSLRAGERSR